jgi:hypothetical protein
MKVFGRHMKVLLVTERHPPRKSRLLQFGVETIRTSQVVDQDHPKPDDAGFEVCMDGTFLFSYFSTCPSERFLWAGVKLGSHSSSTVLTYRRATNSRLVDDRSCFFKFLHQIHHCAMCYWIPFRISCIKLILHLPLGPFLTTTKKHYLCPFIQC